MSRKIEHEEFVHLKGCIEDLNLARNLFLDVRSSTNNRLRGPAFQFGIVVYARSYKSSYGKEKPKHYLDTKHIPTKHLSLHKKLVQTRDQIIAHSDITAKDAVLHVKDFPWGRYTGITQRNLFGTEELTRIDAIVELIEMTLLNLYTLRDQQSENLTPTE